MIKKRKSFFSFPRSRRVFFLLAMLVFLLVLDAQRPGGVFRTFFRKHFDLSCFFPTPSTSVVAKQFNFHVVAPGIWRSAQPNEGSLERMKRYNLKTIIDLRFNGESGEWERELSRKLGIRYYQFPLHPAKVQDLKTIDTVLMILSDPAQQPVLVHCLAGKDRTGLMIAAYKIARMRQKFEDVLQEMLMYGHDEKRYPAVLKSLELWCAARGYPAVARDIAAYMKNSSGKVKSEKN